jgi:putative endonuclease
MYYTYILKSEYDGGYYYGSTSSLEERLKAHNRGKVRSTKGRRPLIIHYYEVYSSKEECIKRESYFKSIEGYNWLKLYKII